MGRKLMKIHKNRVILKSISHFYYYDKIDISLLYSIIGD